MTPEQLEDERERAENVFIERVLREVTGSLRTETHKGVADGIVEAGQRLLTPENAELFWNGAIKALKKNAANKAGTWLIGGMGKAASAAAWAIVLFVALWMSIGWHGMVAVIKAVAEARSAP
jgi:hypothetical protein